jgi:hypothetical protein
VKANPALIRGCRVWDRLTTRLKHEKTPEDRNFYLEEDYDQLKCRIDGDHAEVTVGSSPGHKTHISLDTGKVEYYDSDAKVNTVMFKIFSDIGLDCWLDLYGGVKCDGVRDDNVRNVFKALAMPTSMDIRLNTCEMFSTMIPEVAKEHCMKREMTFYRQNVVPV